MYPQLVRVVVSFSILLGIPQLLIGAAQGYASPEASMSLRGSNGYVITIEGAGNRVRLTAQQRFTTMTYETLGAVSAGRISARFAHRGHISMSFVPEGRPLVVGPPANCRGRVGRRQSGHFNGVIQFGGPGHYTSVQAHTAKGVLSSSHWKCRRPTVRDLLTTGTTDLVLRRIVAVAPSGRRRLEILTGELDGRAAVTVASASVTTLEGNISVSRNTAAISPARIAAITGSAASNSKIVLPSPFSGEATLYSSSPTQRSQWLGDLAVRFPDRTHFRLAGPKFATHSEVFHRRR
jgi:hypothetical protein